MRSVCGKARQRGGGNLGLYLTTERSFDVDNSVSKAGFMKSEACLLQAGEGDTRKWRGGCLKLSRITANSQQKGRTKPVGRPEL